MASRFAKKPLQSPSSVSSSSPSPRRRGASEPATPVGAVRPKVLFQPLPEPTEEELTAARNAFSSAIASAGKSEEDSPTLSLSQTREVLRVLHFDRTLVQVSAIRHLCGSDPTASADAWDEESVVDALRYCHRQGRLTEDGMKYALDFLTKEGTITRQHLERMLRGADGSKLDAEEMDELLTDEIGLPKTGRIGPEIFIERILHPRSDSPPPRGTMARRHTDAEAAKRSPATKRKF